MGKKRRQKSRNPSPEAVRPAGTAVSVTVEAPAGVVGAGAVRPGGASRKKKKQQARAQRRAASRAPVVSTSTTSVPLNLVVLAPVPLNNLPLPTLWADDPASPAELRVSDVGKPADFGAAQSLRGPLGTPAHFEPGAHMAGDLAEPAQFDAGFQLRGPMAGPAHFDDAPPPVAAEPAPVPVVSAPPPVVLPPPVIRAVTSGMPGVAVHPGPSWLVLGSALLLAGSLGLGGYGAWSRFRPRPPPPVVLVEPPPPEPTYATLYKPLPLPTGTKHFEPLAPRAQQVVLKGPRVGGKVALTFDACSTTRFIGWDQRIMDILERYEVPATFFLGGRLVEQRPEIAQLLAQNPLFDLQNHTFVHPHLPEMTPARVVEELARTDRAVFKAVGRRAVMFRPPFGEYSTDVVKAATRAGYLPVQYDVASGDPDPGFYWDKLLESVSTQVGPGSIVVMHANGNGFHTVDALPLIIDVLRSRGLQLTTVGDLLSDGAWTTDDGHKGPQRKKPAEKEKDKATHPARVADRTVPTSSVADGQGLP